MIKNLKKLSKFVNAKTYINREQEFGRNMSLWKEWHKNAENISYRDTLEPIGLQLLLFPWK